VYARFGRSHLVGRVPTRVEAFRGFHGARVGVAYNSHTGILERGNRITVRNIYSTRVSRPTFNRGPTQRAQLGGRFGGLGAARVGPGKGAPGIGGSTPGARGGNEIFASPRGQVFRGSPAMGFQQRVGRGWQRAGAGSNGMLNRESGARALGAQRASGFGAMGGFRGGGIGGGFPGGRSLGGGFHGGGGRVRR
jgi:hypothetical protein